MLVHVRKRQCHSKPININSVQNAMKVGSDGEPPSKQRWVNVIFAGIAL